MITTTRAQELIKMAMGLTVEEMQLLLGSFVAEAGADIAVVMIEGCPEEFEGQDVFEGQVCFDNGVHILEDLVDEDQIESVMTRYGAMSAFDIQLIPQKIVAKRKEF